MPSMVYKWRGGSRIPVQAQAAGEEIEYLRKRANGQLTPAQVVDSARSIKSVLHPAFEWSDAVAAERYREDQARYLIGALVVTVKPAGKQREVRAFVNITKDNQQGYTALHVALSDEELRAQVLVRAWTELRAWQERYDGYLELAKVTEVIKANDPEQSRRDSRRGAA